MLKSSKHVAITIAILLLIVVLVSVTQAQKPTFPPLPDLNRVLSPPGATSTPRPDEKRPDDILKPTVTPIPYKETIDKTRGRVPLDEKATYTIRKKDGNYIQILVAPEQFENAKGQGIRSILELSEGDEIVSFAPPLNLMGQHPSRLGEQAETNTTPTPIAYKIIDQAGDQVPMAKKSAFIILKKNGDYVQILVTPEKVIEAQKYDDPRLILELLGQSEEDTLIDFIPFVNSLNR